MARSRCTALERRGGRLCGIEPAAASVGNVHRSSDTHLQDWKRRSSRCTIHASSAMRYNSAIVALVTRLKSRGRLKPKQIVVAAMRKLLVLCFGVLKTGRPFDAAIAMGG